MPGVVASLQTFGSYGANFHPHVHAIATEGVITCDGRFHPVIWPGKRELAERFRRRPIRLACGSLRACRFLTRLEKAGRLSPSFHTTLLSWRHSGFSVDASQRVAAGESGRLERLARYATRVPLAVGAVRDRPDGKVELDTPPDPKTGARVKVLDRLDFIHAVCQQIPDAKLHQVRYFGAYSCKKRKFLREARATLGGEGPTQKDEVEAEALLVPPTDAPPSATPGSAEARRRPSWARMLKKVFEVDPLVCKRCGEEMEIVAWITKVDVIDPSPEAPAGERTCLALRAMRPPASGLQCPA